MRLTLFIILLGLIAVFLIANVNKSKKWKPKTIPTHENGMEIFLGLRNFVYCDTPFQDLLGEHPADDTVLDDVNSLIKAGNFVNAKNILEQNEANPKLKQNTLYWYLLARCCQMTGDINGAREAILSIARNKTFESRGQLQAWSVLKELGYMPDKPEASKILGVVVEMPINNGTVLIAGFEDGDARLLTSSGFGIIGEMKKIKETANSSKALIKTTERFSDSFSVCSSRPLPDNGKIRFAILTPAGMRVADGILTEVEQPSHHLHPIFIAMNDLLTNLRLAYEQRK